MKEPWKSLQLVEEYGWDFFILKHNGHSESIAIEPPWVENSTKRTPLLGWVGKSMVASFPNRGSVAFYWQPLSHWIRDWRLWSMMTY